MHAALEHPPSNLIAGEWRPLGGDGLQSRNPARPSDVIWAGSPRQSDVAAAVHAARVALPAWSRMGLEARAKVLRRFQSLAAARVDSMAGLVSDEVGKVLWDAKAEAQLLAGKVDITLESGTNSPLRRVSDFVVPVTSTRMGKCTFRPHGVMAILGPFNFPAHLPNGHIIPALAMGNTIVFKPSDKAPAVGQAIAELFQLALRETGAPLGVFNLVQGGADVARELTSAQSDIDGVLFTGSWPVGRSILHANLDRPGRVLALEMGGNNAAVIMPDADLRQAVIEVVRSAFVTTGQRCTCTRRLIVHKAVAERVITAVCKATSGFVIGDPRSGHPVFMGPLINERARTEVLNASDSVARAGARILVACTPIDTPNGGWYVSPGVAHVNAFSLAEDLAVDPGADVEVFGPLLRVSVVSSLNEAIAQANATRFGLAASIFTRDENIAEQFAREVRAGCINVNTGTAGASSKLPFGGLGLSGNHRPAGSFSLDYCAYPVASMVESSDAAPLPTGMTFDDRWVG